MSKKIIAVLAVATIVFVTVFASCNSKNNVKETSPYIEGDEHAFVTDVSGNKQYNENGEFIVNVTNEKKEIVTDEKGENVTSIQPFQAFEHDGILEEYGFRMKIPEGWETTNTKREIKNKKTGATILLEPMNDLYLNKLSEAKQLVAEIKGNPDIKDMYEVDLSDTYAPSKDFSNCYRAILKNDKFIQVSYVFERFNNLYKFIYLYQGNDKAIIDNALKESEGILNSVEFKEHLYFEEREQENTLKVTSTTVASTTEATSTTTTAKAN